MSKSSKKKNSSDTIYPITEGFGGSHLSQVYSSKSERNSVTGVQSRLLRGRSPTL